jgi:hypothetical protein
MEGIRIMSDISERDRHLNMVFTTALEGGIGYWSQAETYKWSDGEPDYNEIADFYADIIDVEDDGKRYRIDRKVISRGIRRAYEAYKGDHDIDSYHWRAISDLNFGKWDDVDYDADTADLIVQFGLFGEAIYS